MQWIIAVKISIRNLLASKLRSFLTVLGVIIGVAAVVVIFAAGQSAQKLIIGRISDTGSNLMAVLPGKSQEDGPPAAAFGITTKTLTYEDYEVLKNPNQLSNIQEAVAYVTGTLSISYKDFEKAVSVEGVTHNYPILENTEVEIGRFFNEGEEKGIDRIAVIGPDLANDAFGRVDVLGEKIKIKNQKFEIVGILEDREGGGFGAGGQNQKVFIPLKTAQKIVYNVDYLNAIRLQAKNAEFIPQTKDSIREILRARHNIDDPEDDDFSVRDLASAIALLTDVTNIIRYFLLAVGSISLLVGGVGIMNIMLIAVNQRVREIGLRKALGARNSDIVTQFIIESIAVSLVGGVMGMILGFIISLLIYVVAHVLGYQWPFIISPLSILVAMVVSVVVGIIFGTYPAKKAAEISPMEALRYE